MKKFNVFDRVSFVGIHSRIPSNATAVIHEIFGENGYLVRVRFDDPEIEMKQSYAAGWSVERWELIENRPDPTEGFFT